MENHIYMSSHESTTTILWQFCVPTVMKYICTAALLLLEFGQQPYKEQ
jgi:hypothetical protein